jgi:hypothetical protein
MGTTIKGAIPSTIRKGGFVVANGRNSRTTTNENCATKYSKEFATIRRKSYTTR